MEKSIEFLYQMKFKLASVSLPRLLLDKNTNTLIGTQYSKRTTELLKLIDEQIEYLYEREARQHKEAQMRRLHWPSDEMGQPVPNWERWYESASHQEIRGVDHFKRNLQDLSTRA